MRKPPVPRKSWLARAVCSALAAAFAIANIAAVENPQDNLTYARIKDAMRRALVDQGLLGNLKFFHEKFYQSQEGEIDLIGPCDSSVWVVATFRNPREEGAASVAAEDLVFQAAIDKLGLRGALKTEYAELDRIGEDFLARDRSEGLTPDQIEDQIGQRLLNPRGPVLHRMAAKLNSIAKEHKLRLPLFEVAGGCGGAGPSIGWIDYKIKSHAAKLMVLSSYDYFICLETNIDPFDVHKCIGWSDVSNPMMGLGPYYYVAQWPDNTQTTGRIVVSSRNPASLLEIEIKK
jgi:hypothetical protein